MAEKFGIGLYRKPVQIVRRRIDAETRRLLAGRGPVAIMPDQQQGLVHDEDTPAFDRRECLPATILKRYQRPRAGAVPCLSRGAFRQQVPVHVCGRGRLGRERARQDGELDQRIQPAQGFIEGDVLLGLLRLQVWQGRVGVSVMTAPGAEGLPQG